MQLNLLSHSSTLPVSLADVKAQLAIDTYDDDTRISALLAAAISHTENETGVALVSQQWKQSEPSHNQWAYHPYGYLPVTRRGVMLGKYPVVSLDSVSYYDVSDTLTSYATSNFVLTNGTNYPAFVWPKWNVILPITSYRHDAWQFTFTCGYSTIPAGLGHAIKLLVSTLNEVREDQTIGTIATAASIGYDRLIAPYKWSGVL